MNCKDDIIDLKGLDDRNKIFILSKERNEFAKSRQQWIQAAFNLAHHEDYTLFNDLVEEELCEKCKRNYSKLVN